MAAEKVKPHMARRTKKNVGVLGLGIIGSRVADNLRDRGFHVFVWNRNPRPVPNFVGAPAELAEMCDYIQIFVSDDDALLDVIRQMAPALGSRHIVIAHPTVAPHSMRMAADLVERRGARFVEAPFTGSKMGAEKGELVFYVAGDEVALREARPILEASAKEIIEIGQIGQATVVKLATNIVTGASVQALAEGLALINHVGIPAEKFVAALQNNASYSKTLAMKLPKMIKNDFEPHFALKHMLKDMKIASQLGLSHHLELAVTTAARDRLLEQEQRGYTEEDFSVIARKYFPEVVFPTIEQDLELFEKPPPIEPAATISSMGEVAASVQQDVNLESLPLEPAPPPPTEPIAEPFVPAQSTGESPVPAATEPSQPQTPAQELASSESATEPQSDQSGTSHSPMDLLAKLLRGESARPDGS
ncbi:MAG TPA: NAD(P)-dependent oxidoreductase [Chthoniobacterales bacterium]|nr:NAD(P)-dependent oxidoreductase [Chthoniobacterales bacterium]